MKCVCVDLASDLHGCLLWCVVHCRVYHRKVKVPFLVWKWQKWWWLSCFCSACVSWSSDLGAADWTHQQNNNFVLLWSLSFIWNTLRALTELFLVLCYWNWHPVLLLLIMLYLFCVLCVCSVIFYLNEGFNMNANGFHCTEWASPLWTKCAEDRTKCWHQVKLSVSILHDLIDLIKRFKRKVHVYVVIVLDFRKVFHQKKFNRFCCLAVCLKNFWTWTWNISNSEKNNVAAVTSSHLLLWQPHHINSCLFPWSQPSLMFSFTHFTQKVKL